VRQDRSVAVKILVTGGAGFLGSYVTDDLLLAGHDVRILDSLDPQVHPGGRVPDHLASDAELIVGDIRSPDTVAEALEGVDGVIHLAARVGVGQSMYELAGYTDVNTRGTAVLLEALAERDVRRVVVASSMCIYGEGLYRRPDGTFADDVVRSREQLQMGAWEPGADLTPVPTPEWKTPRLSSVYALTKYDQELLCLLWGAAYGVPTVALRFFNAYGPRQALSNPYTGVLAIFASRFLNGRPPRIFEDGEQRRDFVSARDVARACRLALDAERAPGRAINIASGHDVSVLDVARVLGHALGLSLDAEITGEARVGDIRHCFADTRMAEEVLGFTAEVELEAGVAELVEWLERQVAEDRVDAATGELAARGLTL
jgi:dTDP-L-rhamnose 4-epimerase